MTVKIGGKTYKGKYKGPDKYKGDEKKLKAYYASKRKTAAKPAPKPVVKAAPKPAPKPTTPLKQVSAPAAGGTVSNSSGTIQLQTNADIENQALEANQTLKDENERATLLEQQGALADETNRFQARNSFQDQRTRSNQLMASRGMRGSAALQQSSLDKSNYQTALQGLDAAKTASDTQAKSIKISAQNWWNTRQGQLKLSRQQYNNEQSAKNPLSGSKPVNSGMKATVPYKAPAKKTVAKPVVKKPVVKTVAKKTYKGKYPGPDKYKGDKKKLAVYYAAKRKVGKK